MITDREARELLHDAAEGYAVTPAPIAAVLDAGADALNRHRRRRLVISVSGGVAVVALLVGIAWTVPQASDRSNGPVSPPATAAPDGWQNMTGPTLANALGLTPVPAAEVKSTPECLGDDGRQKDVVITVPDTFDAPVYCYLPSEYGITDPVEGRLMQWQLLGVPRSHGLIGLATVQEQLQEFMRENGGNHVSPELLPQEQALIRQKAHLEDQVFPPHGNPFDWLARHAHSN